MIETGAGVATAQRALHSARGVWRGFVAWAREYLTLRATAARLERLDEATRKRLAAKVAVARQKRDSAARQLMEGSSAEAIRLGRESLALMAEGSKELEGGGLLDGRATRRLEQANRWIGQVGDGPASDSHVTEAHRSLLRQVLRALYEVEPLLAAKTMDSATLVRVRRAHRALAVFCGAAGVAVLVASLAVRWAPKAHASSRLGIFYGADRSIDGDLQTDWVPQNGAGQWLEIRLPTRGSVTRIELVNGHVLPGHAVKTIDLALYRGHALVWSLLRASLPEAHPATPVTFEVPSVQCDRLRINVVEFYGAGGALSEVIVQ
jgi:hypothetical protein